MRILTYKRTHTGDPNQFGSFGVRDCMGTIRNFGFDAVIGVGGVGVEPRTHGIAGKLTWIGVGPRRSPGQKNSRGDIITFDRFLLLDGMGPELRSVAPNLARRLYSKGARFVLDAYSQAERAEATALLEWTHNTHLEPSSSNVLQPVLGCSRPCKPLKRRIRCA